MSGALKRLDAALAAARSGFELERVSRSCAPDWGIVDGALQHASGGFFSVAGLRTPRAEKVMLYQPQSAITGLLTAWRDGQRVYLLQGRAEPGCLNEAQFGPTVQSTAANYLRAHGGAATSHIDAFIRLPQGAAPLVEATQLDLGERYLFKTKRANIIELADIHDVAPNFVWATADEIGRAVRRSAYFNIDLRALIAAAPWAAEHGAGELTPRASSVGRSLAAPVRAERLGALMTAIAATPRVTARFAPLESLTNWRLGENGLSEIAPDQGFEVGFWRVSAAHREVGEWTQPLVKSAGRGDAVLLCRDAADGVEVWIQVLAETGLSNGAALAPSWLCYPGAAGAPPDWLAPHLGDVWSETEESDEGGRFYKDVSRYRVVRCRDADVRPDGPGAWLRVSELKHCLSMSNLCSIQLRGIASQLLGVE